MKMPVIIAAHNEQETVGRTLNRIDADRFEPVVIANGCTDETARVAKEFGVQVIERYEQGKLPAIQDGLRALGARALGPVFYTDADSYPLSNRYWERIMTAAIDVSRAQFISGPIVHVDGNNRFDDGVRSVKRQIDIRRAKREGSTHCFGANVVSHFENEAMLEQILELPHIWPGEDRAMEELVASSGGQKIQITDLRASVMTSSRYLPSVAHVLKVGKDSARREVLDYYNDRAAPNSIPYGKYARRRNRRMNRNS